MSKRTRNLNLLLKREQEVITPVDVSDPKQIRQSFFDLVQVTCPDGYEVAVYGTMLFNLGFTSHAWGYSATVGDDADQRVIFAAHLDDVSSQHAAVKLTWTDQNEELVGNTAGDILGADDKAGVALVLFLHAHQTPGTYLLFFGEEVGCVGSREWVKGVTAGRYDKMISFDRRGYDSVITHQCSTRTASDEFANALAGSLNAFDAGMHYAPDDGGLFTDSNVARHVIPECTNLSVGCHDSHMVRESQDMPFLELLADSLLGVDWAALPTSRDPSIPEIKSYGYSRYTSRSVSDWDDEELDDWLSGKAGDRKKASIDLELSDLIPGVEDGSLCLRDMDADGWMVHDQLIEFFYLTVLNDPDLARSLSKIIEGGRK